MKTSFDEIELRKRLSSFCDGTIEEAEAAELAALLRENAAARRAYIEYMDLHAAIQWTVSAAPSRPARRRAVKHAPAPTRPMRTWVRFGVAAAIVLVFGVALTLLVAFATGGADQKAKRELVATLVEATDAVWDRSDVPTTLGSQLPGGFLRLRSGTAQVEFYSGAVIVIEGPCEFGLNGPKRGYLKRGKLVAHVPEAARGFTVAGPGVAIVDLGTEFGLEIDAAGRSNVQVFKGSVDVQLTDASGAAVSSIGIAADQAAEIKPGSGVIREVAMDSARFQDMAVGVVTALAAAKPEPLRIMPLGDSLTRGLNGAGNTPGGYRTRLFQRLTKELGPVEFVGSVSDNPDPKNLPDPDHEGHGGNRIDESAAHIDEWISAAAPAIVLVHLGTNDIVQQHDVEKAPLRLDALVQRIIQLSPTTRIIVAQIIPSTEPGAETRIKAYNVQVAAMVAMHVKRGDHVSMVDMHRALVPADFVDVYHPAKAGYDKMADAWFEAIKKLGKVSNPSAKAIKSVPQAEAGEAGPLSRFVVSGEPLGASATIVQVNTADANETFFTPSATDLVNAGQPTLAGVKHEYYKAYNGSTADALNDGVIGKPANLPTVAFDEDGAWSTTYTLDTKLQAAGYDITKIATYAGWPQDRASQKYELFVHRVGSEKFESLGSYAFVRPGGGSTCITVTDKQGPIATGVDAVRFIFMSMKGSNQTEPVYREVDVFGEPHQEAKR
jgi:lysophospholipase L1-like esterase